MRSLKIKHEQKHGEDRVRTLINIKHSRYGNTFT